MKEYVILKRRMPSSRCYGGTEIEDLILPRGVVMALSTYDTWDGRKYVNGVFLESGHKIEIEMDLLECCKELGGGLFAEIAKVEEERQAKLKVEQEAQKKEEAIRQETVGKLRADGTQRYLLDVVAYLRLPWYRRWFTAEPKREHY